MRLPCDAAAPLISRLEALATQKRQLMFEQETIRHRREEWETTQADLNSLEQWCRTVAANLDELTYQQKRMALDTLGFEVRLYRADHDPRYVITASIEPEVVSITT